MIQIFGRQQSQTPLELYLGLWPIALITTFHALLMLTLLSPDHYIVIFGLKTGLDVIWLPLSFVCLKMLFEIYGLKLGFRIAWTGVIVFASMLALLIALLYIPSSQHSLSTITADQLVRIFAAVILALSFGMGLMILSAFLLGDRSNGALLFLKLILPPHLTFSITTILADQFYFGLFAVPIVVWQQTENEIFLAALFLLLLSPISYWLVGFIRRSELARQKRVYDSVLNRAKSMAEVQGYSSKNTQLEVNP